MPTSQQLQLHLFAGDWSNTDLIKQQTLFSVYVNSLAYESLAEPSIFIDSVIEDPVDTSNGYGTFWPVLATLAMIEQALQEPCNQYRFISILHVDGV